jgi:hypothetical protein
MVLVGIFFVWVFCCFVRYVLLHGCGLGGSKILRVSVLIERGEGLEISNCGFLVVME